MTDLHLDFETRSRVDLPSRGLDLYASDPSTRVLMLGWAVDDSTPAIWMPGQAVPSELKDALKDPAVLLWAHNAAFERAVFDRVLDVKLALRRWRCTMVMCYYAALPGKLAEAGAVVGLPEELLKNPDGRRLISRFCSPRRPTKNKPWEWCDESTDPEDWELFVEYCRRDVVAERALHARLRNHAPPPSVWDQYALDQIVNDAGMPVDLNMARRAVEAADRYKTAGVAALARRTGLLNPMSNKQALPWLRERGYPFGDLRKATVAKALLTEGMTPEAREVVEVRAELNAAAVTKFSALLERTGSAARLRGNFQFLGAARTGRWAGRAVQLQNLARPKKQHEKILAPLREALCGADWPELENLGGKNLLAVLTSLLRPVFATPDGFVLRVADLSSIEDRIGAWLAGCETILAEHRQGLDPYKAFGTKLYGVPYDQLTKEQRNNSKPGRLGAIYRLSGGELSQNKHGDEMKTGLWGYAESMGILLTREESHAAVQAYREAYPEVVRSWYALEDAAVNAVTRRATVVFKHVTFDVSGPFLRIQLPSGRHLHYLRPRVEEKTFEGRNGPYKKPSLSYEGADPVTKQWGRLYTHGGKLLENITQAVARDVLVYGMGLAMKEGFEVVGHVHDELITVASTHDEVHTVARLEQLMSTPPPWCRDVPLGAAGYESTFYRKD